MTTSELLLNISISALTGVAASALVWWLSITWPVPKIRFSDTIARTKSNENASGYRYRFKFENYGRRNIIDIEIVVRVRIKGLRPGLPGNNEIVYLPTSSMEYKKVAILRPNRGPNTRAVLEIKPYECAYFEKSIFPAHIRNLAREKRTTLDDVLALPGQVDLQIIALGYDAFSGVRKYFESKYYTAADLITGTFDLGGLSIKPSENVVDDLKPTGDNQNA